MLKTAPSRSRLGNSLKKLEQFSEPRSQGSGCDELGLAGHGPTLFAGLSKHVDLKLVGRLEFGAGGGGDAV